MSYLHRLPLLLVFVGLGALAMLLPAIHGAVMGDHRIGRGFLYSGLSLMLICAMIALASGTSARRLGGPLQGPAFALIAAYGILPPLLALPMAQAGMPFGMAWFDMLSAMTTTGAPLFLGEDLAPTLMLWRAMVGWLGGLFILVMAAAVLLPLGLGGAEVVSERLRQRPDTPDGGGQLSKTALTIFPVYGAATLVMWMALTLAGERSFDALVAAMGVLSTSGISASGTAVAGNSGLLGEMIVFVFLAAALSRNTLPLRAHKGRMMRGERLYDPELRLGMVIVGITSAVLFIYHWIGRTPPTDATALQAIWGGLLLGLSFLTTTGFSTTSTDVALSWAGLVSPGMLLMGLAMIGGGAATAAGGVKLLRIYALLRHGERELERLVHPHSLGGAGQTARYVRRSGAISAWVFFILFALSIAAGTALMTLLGMNFDAAIVFVIAAITNTGPLVTSLPDMGLTYQGLSQGQMVVLGGIMVAGRIELLVLLAVFSPDTWRF
jgi:trk system potassium uptake protein TrkH